MLTGTSGIGKTRVTQEFLRAAALQGARLVRVSTQEADHHRPMSAFSDAVPQLRTLPGAIGVSPSSLEYLLRLTEPPATAPPIEDHVDPHWIAMRIRQSVVDLVDAVATESTVLMLIDDAHWLDAQSWAALAAITDGLSRRRLLFVLTSRLDYPLGDVPQRCVNEFSWHRIPPLDAVAADELVRAVAVTNAGRLDVDDVTWCIGAGEGNPLFLRELAAHRAARHTPDVVPPSLAGLLDGRLDALNPLSRRLVDAVAIADGIATLDELAEILQLTAHEMASALGGLSEAGVLTEDSPTAELRHELLKRRVMGRMSPTVRRLFHRRTAATLSAGRAEAGMTGRVLAAATHWQMAGDLSNAIRTLDTASTNVVALGDVAMAIDLLRHASAIIATHGLQKPELDVRLIRLLTTNGEFQESLDRYNSLKASGALPRSDHSAEARTYSIEAAWRLGWNPHDLIADTYDIAADDTLNLSRRVAAARLGMMIASHHGIEQDQHELWKCIEPFTNRSNQDLGSLLSVEIVYRINVRQLELGITKARELEALTASMEDRLLGMRQLALVADAYRIAGLAQDARRCDEIVYAEATRLDSPQYQAFAAYRMASGALDARDVRSAKQWLTRLESFMSRISFDALMQAVREEKCRIAILERDYRGAHELLSVFAAHQDKSGHNTNWRRRSLATLRLELYMAEFDGAPSEHLVSDLLSAHDTSKHIPSHDRTVAVLAIALDRAGRTAEALELVQRYTNAERTSLSEWERPCIQVAHLCDEPPRDLAATFSDE